MIIFRRWTTLASMLAATLLFVGCASGPPPIPRLEVAPADYTQDYNETWEAVNDVLTEFELPIKVIEKESGVVTTEFVSSGRRYVFFGNKDDAGREISHLAIKTKYYLQIRVQQAEGGKTRVNIIPHVEYMRYQWNSSLHRSVAVGWESCKSHGDIEQEFYDALNQKMNNP